MFSAGAWCRRVTGRRAAVGGSEGPGQPLLAVASVSRRRQPSEESLTKSVEFDHKATGDESVKTPGQGQHGEQGQGADEESPAEVSRAGSGTEVSDIPAEFMSVG